MSDAFPLGQGLPAKAHSMIQPTPERAPADEAVPVRKLGLARRLWNLDAVRQSVLFLVLAAGWELYARHLDNPLLLPTLTETLQALVTDTLSGLLPQRVAYSLRSLGYGLAIGTVLATLLTALAVSTRLGGDFLKLTTAMFNPLPAIALLPVALLWFGIGTGSLVFVIAHSVLWPIALNTYAGFRAVPDSLRIVGLNCGLSRVGYVTQLLIPAAFGSILTGLKIGWAFAWRTLVAAELVFGGAAGASGLGWYIYENRTRMETASVFAGLICVVLIGIAVEALVFRVIEARTVRRWGMQR